MEETGGAEEGDILRLAIELVTATFGPDFGEQDGLFRQTVDYYLSWHGSGNEIVAGLVTLSRMLLAELAVATGRDSAQVLKDFADRLGPSLE